MKLDDDDFALLGLPRRYAVDRSALDERWRTLQAEVHPDRFAAEGGAAQRLAMQWAVRVNEAYRRLRDPIARGATLCELAGVKIDAQRNTAMPADFLHEQMAWREALDEAGDACAVEALDQDVAAREQAMQAELGRLLDEAGDTAAAAQQVRSLMFVARFRDDIHRRLEALDA